MMDLWSRFVKAGDNGLEVSCWELIKLVAASEDMLPPGDGLKVERLLDGRYLVCLWQ